MWWQLFFHLSDVRLSGFVCASIFGHSQSFYFSVNHNYVKINKTKEEKIIGLWGKRERWKRQSLYFFSLLVVEDGSEWWQVTFSPFRFRSKLPRTFKLTVNLFCLLCLSLQNIFDSKVCSMWSWHRIVRPGHESSRPDISCQLLLMRALWITFSSWWHGRHKRWTCFLLRTLRDGASTVSWPECCFIFNFNSNTFFTVKHQALPFNRFLTSRRQLSKKDDREREK